MSIPKKESVRKWLTDQFGDDLDLIGEIYGEYRRTTADNVTKAESAMSAGDYAELDRLAHTLKGNALMVGDQEAADAAYALRNASKACDRKACETALEGIRRIQDD